jgi:hypothetical protein
VAGALDFIDVVTRKYSETLHADVLGQCDAARAAVASYPCLGYQLPIVLLAELRDYPAGPAIDLLAINTNRETEAMVFWFTVGQTVYREVVDLGALKKETEFVFARLVAVEFVDQRRLDRAVTKRTPIGATIELRPPVNSLGAARVLLPDSSGGAVYVAIKDRTGAVSSTVRMADCRAVANGETGRESPTGEDKGSGVFYDEKR